MGENAAKAAASRIDSETWGTGAPGSLKSPCPKKGKRRYRIHPAIGVARVGDSPNEFFIGAETSNYKGPETFCVLETTASKGFTEKPLTAKPDGTRFKDKKYPGARIRRQAARFRIFEYAELKNGEWGWTREINADEAEITWTVKVANKKAVFHEFNGPIMSDTMRSGEAIEPGEKKLTVKCAFSPDKDAYGRAALEDAKTKAKIKYLGDILHDEKGRLVFLGGRGKATGPADIDQYANNAGWVDDVSDGWISAEIRLRDGTIHKTKDYNGDAWVMVGPPDYGPQLTCVVSMYDTMLDIATRLVPKGPEDRVMWTIHGVEDRAKLTFQPHFEHDLKRFFEATYQVNTVFAPANPPMKHPAVYKLAMATKLDDPTEAPADVAKGIAPKAHVRYKVFNTLRPWDEPRRRDPSEAEILTGFEPEPKLPSGQPASYEDRYAKYRWTMPLLWGDSDENQEARYPIPKLLYRMVKCWSAGRFTDTKASDFSAIPTSGLITPGGLDRAALDQIIGGPFFPGIEASWLVRAPEIYVEPFRVLVGRSPKDIKLGGFSSSGVTKAALTVDAGFFSQQMAQPWQADFWACRREESDPLIGWWPSQRPDDVIRGTVAAADPEALLDYTTARGADWKVEKKELEKKGLRVLKDRARNVTISTKGTDTASGPKEAVVEGQDRKKNALKDTIKIGPTAGTYEGSQLFAKIDRISFKGVSGPTHTRTNVAVGYAKVSKDVPAEPHVIQAPLAAETPGELLMVETDLDPPRAILFTIGGGDRDDEGPESATIEGNDAAGAPMSEHVALPAKAGTKSSKKRFARVESVKLGRGRPKSLPGLEIAIGVGAFMDRMVPWDQGVDGWNGLAKDWSRLGFVYDGVEVERDPKL